ncbi:MAG: SDR family oxidoreductase [Halioglobus sp.]
MTQKILIIGASSAIAEATARLYASLGCELFLVARNSEKLEVIAGDLRFRGAVAVNTFSMDANELDKLQEMTTAAWEQLGTVDVALLAYGTLPQQERCESSYEYAVAEFRTNAESVLACLTVLSNRFEQQGSGGLAVIGSVAGDRGRASNYLYGAAKASVDTFVSGLRARLHSVGVNVLIVKPGFVDTPMTAGLDLPGPLVVTADRVAEDILRAISRRKNVLYTPWFWRYIMLIIKHIPLVIFRKMKF